MNYRLSPRELSSPEPVRHPAHANDVHVALEHLLQAYRPKEMYLIGHSCGAHIIGTILQDSPIGTPFIHPSPELLDVIKGVVTAEGIYDLDLLLEDFPTEYYTTFIRGAFGEVQLPLEYNSYKAFSLMDKRLKNPKVKWKVVHSPADTLVNIRQAEQYSKSLERLNDLTDVSLDQSLRFEHDELLDSSDFAKMVVDFIHKPYLP
jgi:acetyl esterase/lipase